jgi:CRISPR-associated protein Cas2
MKIILIYDVSENKTEKIRKECNKYLNWIQNSVFEGDITKSKLMELIANIKCKINCDTDSIIIFKINNSDWIDKEIIGLEKNVISNFI